MSTDQVQVWPEPAGMSLAQLRFHAKLAHRLWADDVKTSRQLRLAHAAWHAEGFHSLHDGHVDHVHAPVEGLRVLGGDDGDAT